MHGEKRVLHDLRDDVWLNLDLQNKFLKDSVEYPVLNDELLARIEKAANRAMTLANSVTGLSSVEYPVLNDELSANIMAIVDSENNQVVLQKQLNEKDKKIIKQNKEINQLHSLIPPHLDPSSAWVVNY